MGGATDGQAKLRDDTAAVAEELAQQSQALHQQQGAGQGGQAQGPQMPGTIDQAKQHLDSAVAFQEQATGELAGKQPATAQPHQKGAEEQLEKALEALTMPKDEKGEQDQKQQSEDGEKEQDKKGQDGEKEQDKKGEEGKQNEEEKEGKQGQDEQKKEEQQEQQAQAVADEKARDILDEERENRDRRRPRQSSGYQGIDRDW